MLLCSFAVNRCQNSYPRRSQWRFPLNLIGVGGTGSSMSVGKPCPGGTSAAHFFTTLT